MSALLTRPLPAGTKQIELGGLRALRTEPGGPPRGVVLHFHGGGFRLGCPESLGAYATALADRCGVAVVAPAYRLAPEHPFPAGLVDARHALTALRQSYDGPVILAGDSAGGALAAGLAALAAEEDGRPPAGLVLHSPWLDLTGSSRSLDSNAATDPLFSKASASQAAELYLQGHSPRDPMASPVFADVAGFPPTLISIGQGEVLLDDARTFHEALQAAGVPSELLVLPAMEHTAVCRNMELAGAAETFEATARFLDRLLG
jgi:acetyl esterase/lipase